MGPSSEHPWESSLINSISGCHTGTWWWGIFPSPLCSLCWMHPRPSVSHYHPWAFLKRLEQLCQNVWGLMMFRIISWPKVRENDPGLLNGKGRILIFNISLLFYNKSHAVVSIDDHINFWAAKCLLMFKPPKTRCILECVWKILEVFTYSTGKFECWTWG